ncbi:hypothetical protein MNBD_ALPHA04-1556 [hydrothermal vent metagenome]|uniref:DUF1178 family protein n=1 Tax=hydrothermal vent metagenome TaxID=652676 RepID=A0A3B0SAL4_9ZZZZ
MIVFDLVCGPHGHQFEGWFASSSQFEEQNNKQMITCPICESVVVKKALMAPNISAKSNQSIAAAQTPEPTSDTEVPQPVSNIVQVPEEYQELLGKLAKAQEKMLDKSEWVGKEFPEQARAIHYGETEEKMIHGEASAQDAEELTEEGIEIAALPLPYTPPKSRN